MFSPEVCMPTSQGGVFIEELSDMFFITLPTWNGIEDITAMFRNKKHWLKLNKPFHIDTSKIDISYMISLSNFYGFDIRNSDYDSSRGVNGMGDNLNFIEKETPLVLGRIKNCDIVFDQTNIIEYENEYLRRFRNKTLELM